VRDASDKSATVSYFIATPKRTNTNFYMKKLESLSYFPLAGCTALSSVGLVLFRIFHIPFSHILSPQTPVRIWETGGTNLFQTSGHGSRVLCAEQMCFGVPKRIDPFWNHRRPIGWRV